MKKKDTTIMPQKSVVGILVVTASILLIPLIAMQVDSGWDWSLSDFIVIGVLLAGTGFLIELVRHTVRNATHKIALILGLVLACLFIWAELAVGIFTNLGS